VAEPVAVEPLLVHPPYALRDSAGRMELLEDLTRLVVGLDTPVQLWHGHRPARLIQPGAGAAQVLTRELAHAARARQSLWCTPGTSPVPGVLPPLPVPWSEGRGGLGFGEQRGARVLALTRFPAAVTPDWLASVARCCVAVAVHLQPLPAEVAAGLLRRRLASMTSSAMVEERAGRLLDPRLDLAADAARTLRTDLALGATRLVRAQVLLAIAGESDQQLARTEQRIRTLLAAAIAQAQVLRFQQTMAWAACQPGGQGLPWPWRLLDAASAAATIPLPLGPAESEVGVLAGVDPDTRTPVLLDRYRAPNPARLVVGTSGAGKSYAAKLELTRQLARGVHAVVIDPEGEFAQLAEVMGGLRLAVGEEPAGLDPVGLACRAQLAPAEGLSVLVSWAAALLGTELGAVDLALLDRALDVLRSDPTAAASAADLLTVIGDLVEHPPFLGADLPARLASAAGGTLAGLFAPNPALADPPPLVVFDLRSVPDRARPAVMSCVLSWAWVQTLGHTDKTRQRLVVIDEAHLLLDDPPAAQLLAQLARRARKYGVALEIITQRLSDFLTHPTGQAVLANTATKLLLGCEDHERAAVQSGLGLTDAETAWLRPGAQGSGLLLASSLRTPLRIVAADPEHVLASAGPR
jgi:type IV secretory pathway VirB4 component